MACSRCGQSRPPRPAPSGVTRPGGAYYPPRSNNTNDNNKSSRSTVKDAISGLRYVPTK